MTTRNPAPDGTSIVALRMAKRRRIEAGVKVALAAVRGDRTTSQLVSAFGVHTTQVGQWKNGCWSRAASVQAITTVAAQD